MERPAPFRICVDHERLARLHRADELAAVRSESARRGRPRSRPSARRHGPRFMRARYRLRKFCSATRWFGGAGRPGPLGTRRGLSLWASRSGHCRRPLIATGPLHMAKTASQGIGRSVKRGKPMTSIGSDSRCVSDRSARGPIGEQHPSPLERWFPSKVSLEPMYRRLLDAAKQRKGFWPPASGPGGAGRAGAAVGGAPKRVARLRHVAPRPGRSAGKG